MESVRASEAYWTYGLATAAMTVEDINKLNTLERTKHLLAAKMEK